MYKTLWFEYAEAHRAILEGKIRRGRPPLSLGDAARCATRGYTAYVDTFEDQVGPDRRAPRRIAIRRRSDVRHGSFHPCEDGFEAARAVR